MKGGPCGPCAAAGAGRASARLIETRNRGKIYASSGLFPAKTIRRRAETALSSSWFAP